VPSAVAADVLVDLRLAGVEEPEKLWVVGVGSVVDDSVKQVGCRDGGAVGERGGVARVKGGCVVPDGLDLVKASTVPLNGLAAAQIVDLLGDAPPNNDRLLVTGAAGAVGGFVTALAQARGWRVTGLARPKDEEFVRSLGAGFTTHAEPGWDAVADGAVLQERGLALVRDGGTFVGVQPNARPATERGITVHAVATHPDGRRLGDLLARAASGRLPARVHAVVPLDHVADAHRAVAKGGVRGRYGLKPLPLRPRPQTEPVSGPVI
jgi:NADPH:quinone reductase-like Zn-dependent oxidoreductase